MTDAIINTNLRTIVFKKDLFAGQIHESTFQVGTDEGILSIDVSPSHQPLPDETDIVRILLNGAVVRRKVYTTANSKPFTFSKVLDKGTYDLKMKFISQTPKRYIRFSASVEEASVQKPPPVPETPKTLCPFIMSFLFIILILMNLIFLNGL